MIWLISTECNCQGACPIRCISHTQLCQRLLFKSHIPSECFFILLPFIAKTEDRQGDDVMLSASFVSSDLGVQDRLREKSHYHVVTAYAVQFLEIWDSASAALAPPLWRFPVVRTLDPSCEHKSDTGI